MKQKGVKLLTEKLVDKYARKKRSMKAALFLRQKNA